MKRKDMSFHLWENYFRTKKLENGHSCALTLTSGPSCDLRAHMWDCRHQGNSMKLWGACQSGIVKTWKVFVRQLYHRLSMQWTLWTSPGPGLASTINVRKHQHVPVDANFKLNIPMQVDKGKIVNLRGQPIILVWYVLIWALVVQKVPVEEDMDGWEVKVYILFDRIFITQCPSPSSSQATSSSIWFFTTRWSSTRTSQRSTSSMDSHRWGPWSFHTLLFGSL